MQIPKNIKITNATGKTVAFLSPKADGLKDAYTDTRLNGESTLEFMLPANSEKIDEITPECEIHANDKVYILRKDDATDFIRDDKNKLWAKFMAVEKWYELDTSYVEPSISNDPTARPPADLAVIIVGGGNNLSGGRYATGTAGHALYAILQGSEWTMGTVDVTGIRDLEMEKASRLQLIKQIQNIWGGYLVWDSVNKIVHLRDGGKWQNYTGFQVRYRKNLKHITRTQSNKLVTKLYAFGHDDLDIANVNGGNKYVTNNSYTSREYVGIYKNQDIYSQQELLEKSQAELELICRPRYLYKVKLVDIRVLPEYSHEDFSLGDMADIIDPDIAPDSPRPRIIRHKYNLFQPWDCELDIGDPEERLVEQLKASFGTTQFIDGKFNGNGEMSGNYLEDMSVGDAKIKNLHADKITAGYISADRIRAGSLTIGHLEEGFVTGLDLLENPVFSSYAQDVSNIDGRVTSQATLIQQNAEQISLQATSISGLGTNVASLDIRAGSIESTVSSLSSTVGSHSSQISQLSNSITLKVSSTDVINMLNINQNGLQIKASNIDLTGITRVYATSGGGFMQMGPCGILIDPKFYNETFSINHDGITGWDIGANAPGGINIGIGCTTQFPNVVFFNGGVDFTRATISGLTLRFA